VDFIRYFLKCPRKTFCFLSVISLCVFTWHIPLHADQRQETVTLQLKWFHQFQFAGYYAAKEKGFFADEGLNVILKERDPSKSIVQAVLDEDVEYGVADASLLLQRIQGKPVILLKQFFQHSPLVLLSLKDSDIVSPYEMIGKKVMLRPTEDAPILSMLLNTIGGLNEIKVVPHSFNQEDLIEGNVDAMVAYLTDAPYQLRQRGVQTNIISPQNFGIDFYGDNLFTSKDEVKDHPERVERMIRASVKGWQYALIHPQEIVDLILMKYKGKLTREELVFEAKMTEMMILPDLIPIGDINPKRYERIVETYARLGMTNEHGVPEDFIYRKEAYRRSDPLTAEERGWLKHHPEIKFGFHDKLEPYIIANPDGTHSGILIDFLNELNHRLGTNINVEVDSLWATLEKAKNSEIDGVLGMAAESADRLGLLKSQSYYTIYPVVYTLSDTPIQGVNDLRDKNVVILKGNYAAEEILKPYQKESNIIKVANSLEALQMVYQGKADVMIGLSSDNYLISKYHLTGLSPSSILWNHSIAAVFGVRPDWPELVSILNKGIRRFSETELNEFVSKWIHSPVARHGIQLTGSEKVWLSEHPVIRSAVDPQWAPIEFVDKSGEPKGVAVDYLNKLGSILNLSFNPVPADSWQDVINMAHKGTADLFPAMSRTVERDQQFEFTRPYISFPIVIFAKDKMHYIGDLKELHKKKVAVIKGHAVDEWLTRDHPEIDIIRKRNVHEVIEKLQSGVVDAVVGNILTISNCISKHGYSNLRVVGETPYSYDLCFAVRREMASLIPILQKGLDTITESEGNQILRRWISIKYEHGFDYALIWKGVIAAAIIILLILFWNRRLSLEVAKRTRALELTQMMVSNVSLGAMVFRSSGECLLVNKSAAKLIGGMKEHLLNQNFRHIKTWQETGLLSLAQKALAANEERDMEINTKTTVGKDVILHCRFIPFQFRHEQHLMLIFEDISARKLAEEALWENEQKYRTLFNSASDAILLIDDNRYMDCNDLALKVFGCTRDQIIGQTPYRYSPARQSDGRDSEESASEKMNRALQGERQLFEWRHCRYDGTIFDAEISLTIIDVIGGKHLLVIVRDITKRKKAEEEKKNLYVMLGQARKMEAIGTLAGGIAHDFNNILSSIFGFTELAKMKLAMGQGIEQYLDEVLSAGIRAKSLVKHMLVFSRRSDIRKDVVAIPPLIKETLSFIRASIPATIEIKSDIGNGDYMVRADPTQIHQVLMNLCSNAAHAMAEKGGLLEVGLEETKISSKSDLKNKKLTHGDYLHLTVADTGYGIKKDHIDRVFDPFFTTKQRGEGTGLGLSVVHGIVKHLEGAVFVDSEPGKGTTIEILIPQYKGEAIAPVEKQHLIKNGRGRILFVDDEKAIIKSNEAILKNLGYEVVSTTSSKEALEFSEHDRMGLILF